MKILNIIPYISSRYGGPPYVAKSLNRLFNKQKIESNILTVDDKIDNEDNIIYFKKTTEKFFFSFDFLVNSIRWIKHTDIMFIHGIYTFVSLWSSIIGVMYKKDIYLLPHGMLDKNSIHSSNKLKSFLRVFFIYTIGFIQVKIAKKLIFNSTKEMNNSSFKEFGMVIPNGVDLQYIDSVKCDVSLFNKEKINLFFLGRLNKIKGIELIIESINQLDKKLLNKIAITIAGSGDDEYVKFIESKIKVDNVFKFIGHLDGNIKYSYLKQCDIYLQPSMTEGLSISMLEAMACKVNMITTNRVGLFEELAEKKAAHIINYEYKSLKEAIEVMIKNKLDYSSDCYFLIQDKYNWNSIIKSYIKVIEAKK